jgi:broad specificity phosphatase PhoE
VLNHERRVNGDPSRPVPLTDHGRDEARLLGLQVSALPLDACFHTRFERTRDTAQLAIEGRDVLMVEQPELDDIRVGKLEGRTIEEYRAWKREHTRSDRFPGGESLDEAALRYAAAYRDLLRRPFDCVLVVCHEIPIRYALNAARGSDDLDAPAHDIPNATPFLFGDGALERAAERVEQLVSAPAGTRSPR